MLEQLLALQYNRERARKLVAQELTQAFKINRGQLCYELGYARSASPLYNWEQCGSPAFTNKLVAYIRNWLETIVHLPIPNTREMFPNLFTAVVIPPVQHTTQNADRSPITSTNTPAPFVTSMYNVKPTVPRSNSNLTPSTDKIPVTIPNQKPVPLPTLLTLPFSLPNNPPNFNKPIVKQNVPDPKSSQNNTNNKEADPIVIPEVAPTVEQSPKQEVKDINKITVIIPPNSICATCRVDQASRIGPYNTFICDKCAIRLITGDEIVKGIEIPEMDFQLQKEQVLYLAGAPGIFILFTTEPPEEIVNFATLNGICLCRATEDLLINDHVLRTYFEPVIPHQFPYYAFLCGGLIVEDWIEGCGRTISDWISYCSTEIRNYEIDREEQVLDNEWQQILINTQNLSTLSLNQYEKEKLINQGAFGKVYSGNYTIGDERYPVAGKKITIRKNAEGMENCKSFIREMEAYELMAYCGVVIKVHGAIVDQTKPDKIVSWIIMDQVKGSIEEFLTSRGNIINRSAETTLTNEDVARFAISIGEAIEKLHFFDYVHRDIKPGNILYNRNENQIEFFLSDFGIARRSLRENQKGTKYPVMDKYICRDPATLISEHSFSSDIYSFGVVLWCLITRGIPWSNLEIAVLNEDVILNAYIQGKRPGVIQDGIFKEVIEKCWDNNDQKNMHEINMTLRSIIWNNFPAVAKSWTIQYLCLYLYTRVHTSNTTYAFHYRRSSPLLEHRRITSLIDYSDKILGTFTDTQLRILGEVVHEGTFINGLAGNRWAGMQPEGLGGHSQRCLYLYRNRVTGKGYVGISKKKEGSKG